MSEAASPSLPIQDALEHYKDKHIAAFLGPPNSGKTVMTVLLKNALFGPFLRKYPDKYLVDMEEGYDYLIPLHDEMQDGRFPVRTPTETDVNVVFSIKNIGSVPGSLLLCMRDMSGEDYAKFFTTHEMPASDKVDEILRWGKLRNKSFGPMSYLIFANTYVILVDCGDYAQWEKLDMKYSLLLKTLRDFQKIKDGTKEITANIAILLTKSDELPDEYAHNTNKALIEEHMPQFAASLKSLHTGILKHIRLYVDVDPEQKQQLKTPLSYSHEQYIKLVDWLIHPS